MGWGGNGERGGGKGPWWEVFMWVMMRFLMAVSSLSFVEAIIVGIVDGREGGNWEGGIANGVDWRTA